MSIRRQSLGLGDFYELVLLEVQERLVEGELDVLGLVKPPASDALLPVQQLPRLIQLRLLDRECVRFDCVDVDSALHEQLPALVEV